MSFDLGVLSSKPIIKAAASMQNDGGAGNLGYMSQGRQQKEENQDEFNIFTPKPEVDTFTFSGTAEQPDVEFSLKEWIYELFESIKNILMGR